MQAMFICGCGHSGTTLVANMFAAHPQVFVPLRETEAFLASNPSVAAELLQEFGASKRQYLVEKTPRHVRAMALIRSVVPGAKFLLMVRDGRDVAASFIKRYGSADTGIQRWLSDNEIVLKETGSADCCRVRYEDLIDDPEGVLRHICRFAGIEFDPVMLRHHEQARMWFGVTELRPGTGENGTEHRLLRNWQVNQPIFDSRGAWAGKLSDEQLSRLESGRGREMMNSFGYL